MAQIIEKAKEELSEIKDKASKALNRTSEEKKQTSEQFLVPATDIYETDQEIALVCDMPGVSKENLKVIIKDEELSLEGAVDAWKHDGETLYSEIYHYNYKRTFILPDTIDRDKINAKLENGVLYISLPKEEKAMPREIPIKMG
jgi:HSP20 family molecular chaperone IbpA